MYPLANQLEATSCSVDFDEIIDMDTNNIEMNSTEFLMNSMYEKWAYIIVEGHASTMPKRIMPNGPLRQKWYINQFGSDNSYDCI